MDLLNDLVRQEVDAYLTIAFKNVVFPAPYAINEFGLALRKLLVDAGIREEEMNDIYDRFMRQETAYGWYAGKATAAQLTEAVPKLLERAEIPAHTVRAYSVIEIMKLYGLGVDCSGFVYNVLLAACQKAGKGDAFVDSLDWRSDKHDVMHAGTFVFAGSASTLIQPKDVRPLDLVMIRSGEEYVHVGLIIERDGKLRLAQSALLTEPSGVSDTPFSVKNDTPVFSISQGLGSDWNKLVKTGALEFRRLTIGVRLFGQ